MLKLNYILILIIVGQLFGISAETLTLSFDHGQSKTLVF